MKWGSSPPIHIYPPHIHSHNCDTGEICLWNYCYLLIDYTPNLELASTSNKRPSCREEKFKISAQPQISGLIEYRTHIFCNDKLIPWYFTGIALIHTFTSVSSHALFFKVKHLRTKYKILDIEVDGGVGIQTIETAAQVSIDIWVQLHNNMVAFKEALHLRGVVKGHAQVACIAAGLVTRGPDSLRRRLCTSNTERKCTSEVLGKPLSCGFTHGSPCSHL